MREETHDKNADYFGQLIEDFRRGQESWKLLEWWDESEHPVEIQDLRDLASYPGDFQAFQPGEGGGDYIEGTKRDKPSAALRAAYKLWCGSVNQQTENEKGE